MNEILSEKEYQKFFLNYLHDNNGYTIRKDKNFDRYYAIDREMLFNFLEETQSETMVALRKVFKSDLEETIVNYINSEVTKERGSLIHTLKHGIEISNHHLDLIYTKPATDFNKDLVHKYENNIFSVMEEVWASDDERVDVVIFLNGLAIMSFELKCNAAGQYYTDAIRQFRTQRNPKTRLFLWKAGCIVNFAMDLEQVYMTTKLAKEATFFMPFNMGNGEGINTGAGNPIFEDHYSVSYMWEDILKKDTILDLINKFIFIEKKDVKNEQTGKIKHSETVIFPRYHQLDLIRKLLADVYENKTSQNYLIQHSAGSGKTNSIAWLAHRLSSFHDANNKIIYDTIIIVTDRVIVDRQLQKAILGLDHQNGLIKVMDEDCSSADLKREIENNTKIIATTIQKFPYIVDSVVNLKQKSFAVIIDEAHSSTAGKDMLAILKALGSGEEEYLDITDYIESQLDKTGKRNNVSMFAFTATPKPTTLRMFGRLNTKGKYQAFHLYSMKQAIEEGFILDVLQNYTTYKTMYEINKKIKDDPTLKTARTKRDIARFAELHDTNINQRIEIIIEHFRNNVMNELNGQAKAMVITSSREAAVKYKLAFEKYIAKKGYANLRALVAFSGKIKLDNNKVEYTEVAMNSMPEKNVPDAFDSETYNVMIVANKYQTGFDQNKLCAMYVLKSLNDVNAVQTLSRLNRVCPPFDKHVFVLDFVNTYDDMKKSFAPYYTTTLLSNDLTPSFIYDLEAKIDAANVIDPLDIDKVFELIFKKRNKTISPKEQNSLIFCLQKSTRIVKSKDKKDQLEFVALLKRFIRFYQYLMTVTCLEDEELYKKYTFISYLISYINIDVGGDGFNLKGKIEASNFVQKKISENVGNNLTSNPIVKLPTADDFNLTEAKKEKLSEIISEINSRTGKKYDQDFTVKAMLQIKDIMMKSDELKRSARSNTEQDFEFSYFGKIDDALIEGLSQNQDFFSLLLDNPEIKKEVLGIFASEIYNSLRKS